MIEQYSYGIEGKPSMTNNVRDMYKKNTAVEVRADIFPNRSKCIMVCQNLTHDFNKATIIRSANAFLIRKVFLVGRHRYDRRGCVGVQKYTKIFHADTMEEVYDYLRDDGYHIIAVDNCPNPYHKPHALSEILYMPERTAFVVGEEQRGLSMESIRDADEMVEIPQLGSVRSLNVSVAASICMYEYNVRYGRV